MDAHSGQCPRRPAKKAVALRVSAKFLLQIHWRGVRPAEILDCQGVIDRCIDWKNGVERARVRTGFGQRVAHGGNVNERRRTCRIVHQHAVRLESDFDFAGAMFQPFDDAFDRKPALVAIRISNHVLEQQAQHDGQTVERFTEHARQVDKPQRRIADRQPRFGIEIASIFHPSYFAFL